METTSRRPIGTGDPYRPLYNDGVWGASCPRTTLQPGADPPWIGHLLRVVADRGSRVAVAKLEAIVEEQTRTRYSQELSAKVGDGVKG